MLIMGQVVNYFSWFNWLPTSVGLTGLTMGATGASYFGTVKLDDVRVYNVALTDTQILELYKGRVSFINFISPTSGGSGGGLT